MEVAIQKLAVIALLVIGFSHVFQPKVWAEFFIYLREKGRIGSFINALIHFPFGALIVAFHNVWTGIPLLLTVLGYCWVIKSLIYLVLPDYGLKSMSRVSVDNSKGFVFVGVVMIICSGVLMFSLATGY